MQVISDSIRDKYDQYCYSIAMQPSSADSILCSKICDYEDNKKYFNDMMFLPDSIVSEYVKFELQDEDGVWRSTTDDLFLSLDENCVRYYVKKLKSGSAGAAYINDYKIVIDPKYAENEDVILHELIHAHEIIINKRRPFYHDILMICLYNDLKNKIPDLDKRILDHTHIIRGNQIYQAGGSHDVLFFLKSLDLDIRCGLKLGTVCGYGRDNFAEVATGIDKA